MTCLPIGCMLVAGLVTSPAVKLSPNARNLVRESRSDGVGPAGGFDSPHPTEIAVMRATRVKHRIKSEQMISEGRPHIFVDVLRQHVERYVAAKNDGVIEGFDVEPRSKR